MLEVPYMGISVWPQRLRGVLLENTIRVFLADCALVAGALYLLSHADVRRINEHARLQVCNDVFVLKRRRRRITKLMARTWFTTTVALQNRFAHVRSLIVDMECEVERLHRSIQAPYNAESKRRQVPDRQS